MANAPRLSVVLDPAKPRKLGRYELEECLGSADGLETFRARVRGLAGFDRIFAVKCLHRPRGTPVNLNDPYIKTARRLASINDPRVARVLDADVIDGVAVAVTEFVHGLDLDRFRECAQYSGVLATGSDETAEKWQKIVAYIGAEAAGGLCVIHGLAPPLVHAALSPRNIVATARGGIKVLDAGLARAANPAPDVSSRRSLAYGPAGGAGADPNPETDMRGLGAILFELATGELPARESASALARRALDALWPAMADFIAGLLADDPALRPTAAQAAKILSDYWSDIPDASMVTEMAALVRNFSAFVADAAVQSTPAPVQEPRLETRPAARSEPASNSGRAGILSISPPARPPEADPSATVEGSVAAELSVSTGFQDEPTVVRDSSGYAAALFQALPPEGDAPALVTPPAEPIEPLLEELGTPPSRATLMAYPTLADPPSALEADETMPIELGPSDDSEFSSDTTAGEAAPSLASDPIPEVADWGAQALAALGDQAGVSISPLVPPLPLVDAASAELPPPVRDPTIDEAFAFESSPPPTDAAVDESVTVEPMLVAQATFDAEDPAQEVAPVVAGESSLLEDELVDEGHDVGGGAHAAAFVEVQSLYPGATEAAGDEAFPSGSQFSPLDAAAEPSALVAVAFEEECEIPPAELEQPRPAQAMQAPQEDDGRYPVPRTAAGSSAGLRDDEMAEIFADSGRGKKVAFGIVLFLLVGGAVAGALVGLGVFGARHRLPVAQRMALHPGQAAEATQPATLAAKTSAEPSEAAATAAAKTEKAAPSKVAAPTAHDIAVRAPDKAASTLGPLAVPRTSEAGRGGAGSGMVSVSVTSKPAGATVWINGEERGTTPCTLRMVPGSAGLLTLVRAGHISSTTTVQVSEGKPIDATLQAVEPPMSGDARFRVECKTEGKLPIVVDGHETGVMCPFSKLRVEPGDHSIGVLVPATGKLHAKEITLSAGVRSIVFGD